MLAQGLDGLVTALVVVAMIAAVVLATVLVIAVLYLRTLQMALGRVSPRNRLMRPGTVWLSLIPGFHFIWQFYLAVRVPGSLKNEFREKGRDDGSDYGESLALSQAIPGITAFIVSACLLVTDNGNLILIGTSIHGFMGLVWLVLFIGFWVKIARYCSQLKSVDGHRLADLVRKLDQFDDDDGYGRSPEPVRAKPPPDTFKEGDPERYT